MKSYILLLAAFIFSVVPQVSVQRSVFSPLESAQFKIMPRGVLNLKTKETLVVWERHPGNHPGHSIWGRLLNSHGKAAGPEFVIVSGPNTYGPSLTYNAQRNEYLLVYANEGSSVGFAIFGQRLNAKGGRLGPAIRLSPEADAALPVNNERPLAIWNARTGNYQLFWQRDKFSSSTNVSEGLYGAVLTGTLSAIQNPKLIVSAKQDGAFVILPFITDAAIHPITGKLLVGFYEYAPGFATSSGRPKVFYFVANIDPGLNAIHASDFTKVKQGTSVLNGDIRFAFLTDGSGLVVFPDTSSLKLRKI